MLGLRDPRRDVVGQGVAEHVLQGSLALDGTTTPPDHNDKFAFIIYRFGVVRAGRDRLAITDDRGRRLGENGRVLRIVSPPELPSNPLDWNSAAWAR